MASVPATTEPAVALHRQAEAAPLVGAASGGEELPRGVAGVRVHFPLPLPLPLLLEQQPAAAEVSAAAPSTQLAPRAGPGIHLWQAQDLALQPVGAQLTEAAQPLLALPVEDPQSPAIASGTQHTPSSVSPYHAQQIPADGSRQHSVTIAPQHVQVSNDGGPSFSALRSPNSTMHGAPRKNVSGVSHLGTEASSRDFHDHDTQSFSSMAISDGTSSITDLDMATLQALREQGRQPPGRHASMPAIQYDPCGLHGKAVPHRVSSMTNSPGAGVGVALVAAHTSSTQYAGGATSIASTSSGGAAPSNGAEAPAAAMAAGEDTSMAAAGAGAGPSSSRVHGPAKAPSRLGPAAASGGAAERGERPSVPRHSMDLAASSSHMASSSSLATLQKTVEQMMLQDSEVLHKVQSSMRGISSLAKETTNLEMGRDATGATCINQYVVVKTLGRGSFGKVKLCLNTLDGQLYAIKMVNRSFLFKQLARPQKGLRKRQPARNTSGQQALSSSMGSNAAAAATAGLSSNGMPAAAPGPSSSTAATSSSSASNAAVAAAAAASGVETVDLATAGRAAAQVAEPMSTGSAMVSSRISTEDANPLDSVMREIAVLKKLDHPNVVKLHEVIDPPGASHMMLVMEYMERGPVLETKVQTGFGSFPERIARNYFRQACAGLDYLHYHNVVHGDLKPENLLVTSAGQLKIGDFGSARMMSDSSASSKVSGTPAFQPPEVLTNPGSEDPHSADVWALGVCLFCFIFGRLPFTGSCLLDISNAIRNDEVRFPPKVSISADLQDLFQRVLDKEPATRLTLRGLMEHAWVTERGEAPLPSLRSLLTPPKMIEVSRNEAQLAIDRDSMVSMIRARLKEKTFAPGEVLFTEGDEAHCIYMIMSGVVEIITRLNKNVDTSMVDTFEEQSFSVDMDESFTLDCSQLVPTGLDIKDGRLHIDREQAQALKERMRTVLLNREAEYVTEVKGPGQVIGDVGLDKSQVARHQHTARVRDTVTVVKLTEESFLQAMMQQTAVGMAGMVMSSAQEEDTLHSSKNADDTGESHEAAVQPSPALPLTAPATTPQPHLAAHSATVAGAHPHCHGGPVPASRAISTIVDADTANPDSEVPVGSL